VAGDDGRVDVKHGVEGVAPLVAQVSGNAHEDASGAAAGEQFGQDEAGFYGLAGAHVVGDQEPDTFAIQRH
jgi:hypothetical protein